MPNMELGYHEREVKPGGWGWLYNEEQKLLTQFRCGAATLHAK